MKTFLASLPVLALLASGPFQPWSEELLSGEWGALYDDGTSASSIQYFRFEPDGGALWVQSYRGDDAMHFEFPAEGVVEDNGLVILTANPNEDLMVRFVVSAYRISENEDTGLATGYLYMFRKKESGWVLYNSLPFRGRPLEAGDPIYSHEQLRPFIDE